jgi:hypothetical protein
MDPKSIVGNTKMCLNVSIQILDKQIGNQVKKKHLVIL